jgi:proline iminopeptidase
MRAPFVLLGLLLVACHPPSSPARADDVRACGDGPTVVVVHGGPGASSYNFERSVGPRLERELRMVYVDQRGCGRSTTVSGHPRLGMEATVDDLERVRQQVGGPRWILLGHSFGGVVALEYARRYHEHVAGLVLDETTGDLPAALEHQIQTLARLGPERFAEHAAELARIAAEKGSPFARLGHCYALLGRVPLQRAIVFASDEGQRQLERWDEDNAFRCGGNVAKIYADEGWLDRPRPELLHRLDCPTVVFAGRRSDVIGAATVTAAAQAWGAPIVWFEHSGHFPNIEEPEAFAGALVAFARPLAR